MEDDLEAELNEEEFYEPLPALTNDVQMQSLEGEVDYDEEGEES